MTSTKSHIAENYQRVLDRCNAACLRSGRSASSVKLVAVTKYAEVDWIQTLVELGIKDLGENRPQQLIQRATEIPLNACWHLIGHLQRNKVRPVLPMVTLIHSVDTLRLLAKIDFVAKELNCQPHVLLEVNVSGEAAKNGFSANELIANWDKVLRLGHLRVNGLMTMAPYSKHPEDSRPIFQRLRELRNGLAAKSPESVLLPELSMGMSGDFDVAVEEGATMIRIGNNLFNGLESTLAQP